MLGINTLKLMLHGHKEVDCTLEENYKLYVNKLAKFVKNQYELHPGQDYKRCYSNNNDIFQPCTLQSIHKHFPETKLLIALRHPVRYVSNVNDLQFF